MKNRVFSIILTASMFAMPLIALAFTDVQPDSPYFVAIDYLSGEGVFEGYDDGTFRLYDEITRAEFCKIVMSVFGNSDLSGKPSGAALFSDIDTHWAKEYIVAAADMGYVNGIGDGLFAPNDNITCEQAIAIVVRIISGSKRSYPIDYLAYAMDEEISSGVPVITGRNITRGEAAQIIYNVLERRRFEEQERAIMREMVARNELMASLPAMASPLVPPSEIFVTEPPPGISVSPVPDFDSSISEAPLSPDMSIPFYPEDGMPYILPPPGYHNTEEYLTNSENTFKSPVTSPLSTFSLDVNTASYSIIRRNLLDGRMPDRGAFKIEEMINYFDYALERPVSGAPFAVSTEVQVCPWNGDNYLAMIALQGYDVGKEDLPPSNLVFLIDISGSMNPPKRLPLAQRAMCLLVDQLREQDTVTLVVYASSTGTVLEATSGSEKETIKNAIYGLRAGGSTNGAGGILLAYEEAGKSFVKGGNNRVILCTDGDFNVGVSSVSALEDLITEQRESGIFLSVLGFGMGNYKDNKMETLATKGNGNYAYIDNLKEAKKVLVDDMTSTIFTIAKDVKLQVEFNPDTVSAYRLIGYEKRLLNAEDFADDRKDAGEMGAGHSMIAFYEIVPAGAGVPDGAELKYQVTQTTNSTELMNIELRYKAPDSDTSTLMEPVVVTGVADAPPSENFRFASAVAEWGLLLSGSEYAAGASVNSVLNRAYGSMGADPFGYRAEFVQLVDLGRLIKK